VAEAKLDFGTQDRIVCNSTVRVFTIEKNLCPKRHLTNDTYKTTHKHKNVVEVDFHIFFIKKLKKYLDVYTIFLLINPLFLLIA